MAGGVAQGEGPMFKPQYHKKRREKSGSEGQRLHVSPICGS
jgi:hypothetical protein